MPKEKLKKKYWHQEKKNNWVFGVKKDDEIKLRVQLHSKISIQRHAKVKGAASPFNGNIIYWAQRTGKSSLIPPMKARLIQEQKGCCAICGELFLPDDKIDCDHIIPKVLGGKNCRENVQVVHHDCHLEKTRKDLTDIRRNNVKT